MKVIKKLKICSILSIVFLVSCSHNTNVGKNRVGSTIPVSNKNIEWESYDVKSTLKMNDIKYEDLQGNWGAVEGVYRFGEHINGMKLNKPIVVAIKDETIKRSVKGKFEKFKIEENKLICNNKTEIDTGIVNLITPNSLTISWKNKSNYTRYFYKK